MATNAKTAPSPQSETTSSLGGVPAGDHPNAGGPYVMPVVHVHLPETWVSGGFWGVLAGAALLGAVDPPLALLIGAGVVVARHRRSG